MTSTVLLPSTRPAGVRTHPPARVPLRLSGVDELRGLVCLSITLGHLFTDGLGIHALGLRPGAECFMVLSGYMLARMLRPTGATGTVARVARRRFLRLFVPYAVALTLCLPALPLAAECGRWLGYPNARALPDAGTFALDYLAALASVSDLAGRGVWDGFWSMVVLNQATVLIAGTLWVVRDGLFGGPPTADRRAFAVVSALMALGFVATLPRAAERDWGAWWMLWNFAYLSAGWLVAVAPAAVVGWVAAAVGGGLVATGFWGFWSATPGQVVYLPVRPIHAAAVVFVLWGLTVRNGKPLPRAFGPLAFVGRRSYSLYLLHMTAGGLVLHALRHLWPATAAGWPLVAAAAAALLAAFAAAEVFFRLVERPLADRSRSAPGYKAGNPTQT